MHKIGLSVKYGKALYAVSILVTLSAAVVAFLSPVSIPTLFLLKILSIPVILFLVNSLQKGNAIYFWINIGISRKEYYFIPIILEFILFVLIISLAGILGNVIG